MLRGQILTTNANTTIIIVGPQSSFSLSTTKHQNQSINKILINVHCIWICWKHLGRATSKTFLQILSKKNANLISIEILTIAILKFLPFA
jgi:hypothetical protein